MFFKWTVEKAKEKYENILVAYCYDDENKGDAAITLGLMRLLSEKFPKARITLMSMFSEEDPRFLKSCKYIKKWYPNVSIVGSIIPNRSPLRKLLFSLILFLFPRLYLRMTSKKGSLYAILTSNIIISNGGYLFYTFPSKINWIESLQKIIFPFAYPLILARRLGIPYGFYAQSFGPFKGFTRFIMKWLFSGAAFIYARESISLQNVLSLGIRKESHFLKVVPDLSFSFGQKDEGEAAKILQNYSLTSKQFIGITVRRSSFAGGSIHDTTYHRYVSKMAEIIDLWINKKGSAIAIFSQTINPRWYVENDFKSAMGVYKLVSNKARCVLIKEDLPPQVLRALYGHARVFLGARLHSVIFALMEGVPVVALEDYYFGPKTLGIMKDLGLNEYVFLIEKLDPEEIFLALDFLDRNKNKFLSVIKRRVSTLQKEAEVAIKNIELTCNA